MENSRYKDVKYFILRYLLVLIFIGMFSDKRIFNYFPDLINEKSPITMKDLNKLNGMIENGQMDIKDIPKECKIINRDEFLEKDYERKKWIEGEYEII